MGVSGHSHAPTALPCGMTRCSVYGRMGGSPGTVWTSVEKVKLRRIRSADRPGRTESLYRLSYSDRNVMGIGVKAVGSWTLKFTCFSGEINVWSLFPLCYAFIECKEANLSLLDYLICFIKFCFGLGWRRDLPSSGKSRDVAWGQATPTRPLKRKRSVVPKRHCPITSHKKEDINCTAKETWKLSWVKTIQNYALRYFILLVPVAARSKA